MELHLSYWRSFEIESIGLFGMGPAHAQDDEISEEHESDVVRGKVRADHTTFFLSTIWEDSEGSRYRIGISSHFGSLSGYGCLEYSDSLCPIGFHRVVGSLTDFGILIPSGALASFGFITSYGSLPRVGVLLPTGSLP